MSTPHSAPGDPNQPQERIVYVEKKKKGGCMKWGAIIIGALIVLGILFAALGGGDDSADEGQGNDTGDTAQDNGAAEGMEEQTSFQAGETYTTGEDLAITVTGFRTTADAMGTQFTCGDVTYTNNGNEQVSFSGAWDWKMQNPAGVITDPALTGENTLNSGDLAPGGSVSGSVCFDGAESGEYRLIYEPTLSFSSDTATWVANI